MEGVIVGMPIEKKRITRPRKKNMRRAPMSEKPAAQLTMMNTGTLQANRLIADFMKASNRLEQYLHKKGPLTDLQYESVETTLEGLRTFLLTWRTHFRAGRR